MAGYPGWDRALLRLIGAPASPQNLRALSAWQQAEGGSARFNPLNTTQRTRGSLSSYNSVGVQNYSNAAAGAQATAQTLLNGRYGGIVRSLRSSANPRQTLSALASSPWGTGSLALKVLGQGGALPSFGGQPLQRPGVTPQNISYVQNNAVREQLAQSLMQGFAGLSRHETPDIAYQASLLRSLTQPVRGAPAGADHQGPIMTLRDQATSGDVARWVALSPHADRPGAHTSQDVINFVGALGHSAGEKLIIGTGTNHNQYVVGTHRQSAHWTGNAADVPASGAALTRLGRLALIQAGMPAAQAKRVNGGLFNIGHYQIIFNTLEGGNHYKHLHVGIRG